METLKSELFRGDSRLAKTLVSDPDHVAPSATGEFVSRIQNAVLVLQGGQISAHELRKRFYGPDTAKLVLAYKTRLKIINTKYQNTADNIVGKMTIKSLDDDMVIYEAAERQRQMHNRR